MSIAAIVRAMVEAGCSPAQILAVVEQAEASRDAAAEARRAKEAAKKRRQRSFAVPNVPDVPNVPGTSGDMVPPPASPSSFPPTPPLITTPTPTPSDTFSERAREADFRSAISDLYQRHGYLPPETGTCVVWLKQGRDSDICLAVIDDHLRRKGKSLPLSYFAGPIADAHAAPPVGKPSPARAPPIRATRKDGWAELFRKSHGIGEFSNEQSDDAGPSRTVDAFAVVAGGRS
jgi:hypothetical protein